MSDTHVPRAAKACPQKKIKKERRGFGRTGFLRLLHTPEKISTETTRGSDTQRGQKHSSLHVRDGILTLQSSMNKCPMACGKVSFTAE